MVFSACYIQYRPLGEESKASALGLAHAGASCCFNFLVTIVFWYEFLFQINLVSKELQSECKDLASAIDSLEKTCKWLKNYQNIGFAGAIATATELAEDLEVVPVFKNRRLRRKKKLFEYESKDEPTEDVQEHFRISCFNQIMDTIITKLDCRFEQLRQHHSRFGFLYLFSGVTTDDVRKSAKDLEVELSHGDSRYIDSFMLSEEIQMLKPILQESALNDPLKILLFLSSRNRAADFLNFFTALRILLTVPVTVASGKSSFSKLKLIKNYLRLTMLKDRLCKLSILSIENEVAKSIDYSEVIDDFASLKARKMLM